MPKVRILISNSVKANYVLGYSIGSFVAQQLAVAHAEKINRLILVEASCGGKGSIPPSPQVAKFFTEIANKSINNITITQQDVLVCVFD